MCIFGGVHGTHPDQRPTGKSKRNLKTEKRKQRENFSKSIKYFNVFLEQSCSDDIMGNFDNINKPNSKIFALDWSVTVRNNIEFFSCDGSLVS